MGKILDFHVRASSGSIKKSSILTSPPVASLNRRARAIDTPRLPFKTKERCDTEQPDSEANLVWLIFSLRASIHVASGCFVSISVTLLLAKSICQALVCCGEMDMPAKTADHLLMAKTRKPAVLKPLYVGPWIRACKTTPREVVRKIGINEGYLSGIISGKKKNPSSAMLEQIAACLDIPMGNFYKMPPSEAVLDQIADFDPEVVVRLSQNRKK